MVDFNSENTIGTPAADIVRVLILEKRNNFLLAWEFYRKQKLLKVNAGWPDVVVRLEAFFLELQAALKRRFLAGKKSKEEREAESRFVELEELARKPENDEDVMLVYYALNEELDKMNLTKIDGKKDYDKTRVEAENKEWGL